MSAAPAGYEDFYDDSDDSEYDGFSFSGPSPSTVRSFEPVTTSANAPKKTVGCTPAGGEGSEDDEDELVFGDQNWNGGEEWRPITSAPSQEESMKSSRRRPGSGSSNKKVTFDDTRKTSPTKASGKTADQRPAYDPISEGDFKVAVRKGSKATVEKLIEKGAEVDKAMKRCGWTPLMYAVNYGQPEICKLLLDKGANPNFQKDLITVLMAASQSNSKKEEDLVQCVDYLLDKGAKIKAFDRYRMSPLSHAAKEGHNLVVERLLQKGADINQQDSSGWTPLCYAADRGNIAVVRVLLEANADTTIRTQQHCQSASDLAYDKGHHAISELIDAKGNATSGNRESDDSSSAAVSVESSSSKQAAAYVRYGDLEIFLFGLELGSLIQTFQDHQISFEALLKMTDEDLQQIGISQVGIRKKILEAIKDVHTKEWDMTRFVQQTNQQSLRAQDIALIFANTSKHLKYIKSSVMYVKKYLQSVKNVQEITQDVMEAQQMLEQSQEAAKTSGLLKTELLSLNHNIGEISREIAKTSPDLIQDREINLSKKRARWTSYVLLSTAAILLGILAVRRYKQGEFTS